MALTNSSTVDDVINQYLANSDWSGDRSRAVLRKEAIDWLLLNRPSYSISERSVTIDYRELRDEIQQLNQFMTQTSTARCSFTRGVPVDFGR